MILFDSLANIELERGCPIISSRALAFDAYLEVIPRSHFQLPRSNFVIARHSMGEEQSYLMRDAGLNRAHSSSVHSLGIDDLTPQPAICVEPVAAY